MLHIVPEEMRNKLKVPLGELIPDEDVTKELLFENGFGEDRTIKASIGDRTTERIMDFGFLPSLAIIDRIEKRKPRPRKFSFPLPKERILRARNPAGSISDDALDAISKSIGLLEKDKMLPVLIDIEGEEDLLALPVLAFFPDNSKVFYGQPSRGLVVVRIDERTRKHSLMLLCKIRIFSLTK